MTAKNVVFGAALAATVLTAGTPGLAAERAQEPRRNVMVLDGRGGQLGVMVEDTKAGVRIGEVNTGSAAEKAGIKEGDLIVEYDGERVRSARQLTRLVQETADGRSVKIAIDRGGQRQTVEATPEARSFSWDVDIDGDRIRRDIERGMQGFREFRLDPPALDFHYDGEPRRFDFRMDDLMPVSRGRLGVSVQSLSPQLADILRRQGRRRAGLQRDQGLGRRKGRAQSRRRHHVDRRRCRPRPRGVDERDHRQERRGDDRHRARSEAVDGEGND